MEIDPALLLQQSRVGDIPIDPRLGRTGIQGNTIHPSLDEYHQRGGVSSVNTGWGTKGYHEASEESESEDGTDTTMEHSSEGGARLVGVEHDESRLVVGVSGEGVDEGGSGLGEEYDPSIREIVKSLAHAQQNSTDHPDLISPSIQPAPITDDVTDEALSQALRYAQTVGAMSAQMGETEDVQIGLDMQGVGGLPKNLAEFSTDFESLFQPSHHDPNFLLPDYSEPGPSTHPFARHPDDFDLFPNASPIPSAHQDINSINSPSDVPAKRGRGRPKGSKNRPKTLEAPPKPSSDPKPRQRLPKEKPLGPVRKVGRPPKIRTGEELEAFTRRQQEVEMGIQRRRGRPRKFPGYLVREMRLKRNREEFREVVKRYTEGEENEVLDLQMGVEDYDWANDPQNLMDAVVGLNTPGASEEMFLDQQHHGGGEGEEEPSANTGLGGDGVGEVFGLHQAETEET